MNPVLHYLVFVLIATFIFSTGLEAPPGEILAALRRPRPLLMALIPALVLIPLVVVWPVLHLGLPRPVAVAAALLAVAPGAPFVLRAVQKAGGALSFAHAFNLVLALLTVFTAPAIVRWARSGDDVLWIEPGRLIVELLLLQVVPLVAGVAIQVRWPKAAAQLDRFAKATFAAIVLVLLLAGLRAEVRAVSSLGLVGLVVTIATAAIAWALGWTGGYDGPSRRAVALTCGVPNIGLALVILNAADTPRIFITVTAGMWLLRVLLNVGFTNVLARRPTQPPARFEPQRYEPTRREPPSAPPPA